MHRVLPLPGRLPRDPRPRGEQDGLRRPAVLRPLRRARDAPARHQRPSPAPPAGAGPRQVQHHQVLHRGVPRAHQDHRQRHHPAEGAGGRRPLRPRGLARAQDPSQDQGDPGRGRRLVTGHRVRPPCSPPSRSTGIPKPGSVALLATWRTIPGPVPGGRDAGTEDADTDTSGPGGVRSARRDGAVPLGGLGGRLRRRPRGRRRARSGGRRRSRCRRRDVLGGPVGPRRTRRRHRPPSSPWPTAGST